MKSLKRNIPSGTLFSYAGGTLPSGFLLCDGSTVSRALYPALYAAIGNSHGQGDGTTTFHLPDYRGRFLRGADNMGTGAAGRDTDAATRTAPNTGGATGNTVASVQGSANAAHGHLIQRTNGGGVNVGVGGGYIAYGGLASGYQGIVEPTSSSGGDGRPQNANVLYMIKT